MGLRGKKAIPLTEKDIEMCLMYFSSTLDAPVTVCELSEIYDVTETAVRYTIRKKFVKSEYFDPDTMKHYGYRFGNYPIVITYDRNGNSTTTYINRDEVIDIKTEVINTEATLNEETNYIGDAETVNNNEIFSFLKRFGINTRYGSHYMAKVNISESNVVYKSMTEILTNNTIISSNNHAFFKRYFDSLDINKVYIIKAEMDKIPSVMYIYMIKAMIDSKKNIAIDINGNICNMSGDTTERRSRFSRMIDWVDKEFISEGVYSLGIDPDDLNTIESGYVIKLIAEESTTINHDSTIDKDYKGAWIFINDRDLLLQVYSDMFKYIDNTDDEYITSCIMKYAVENNKLVFKKTLVR